MPGVAPVVVAAGRPLPEAEVHIPASVAARLGLPAGGSVHVATRSSVEAGRVVIEADPAGGGAPVLWVHPRLLHELRIPSGVALRARYEPTTRTLSLGPFVGILALRSRRGSRYGEHEPFFRALTRMGQRLHVGAFVFGPRDVDWSRRQVFGYAYVGSRPQGSWRRSVYPLPDVVYDRVQTRKAEGSKGFAAFRTRLAQAVPRWFNEPGFFDKWRMHTALYQNERLRRFLPETALYRGPADLAHFLDKYGIAYMKPVGGSLGLGIVRLHRTEDGYVASYQPGETLLMRRASSIRSLAQIVARLTRRGPFIIQQGLPLARWRGRVFDVRILMQRTTGGAWALTKMFSRIAPAGSFTANLTRGGQGCRIDWLLRRVYGSRWPAVHRALRAAGFELAREIEKTIPGVIGELGLDLGLDRRGRIWLIEVNSKPFLQMTREAGSVRTLSLSVQRPLRFAAYLAGFDENGTDADEERCERD